MFVLQKNHLHIPVMSGDYFGFFWMKYGVIAFNWADKVGSMAMFHTFLVSLLL